jgi:hypothetical protein
LPATVPARAQRASRARASGEVVAGSDASIATLPGRCRDLGHPQPVEPQVSAGLRAAAERVDREFP